MDTLQFLIPFENVGAISISTVRFAIPFENENDMQQVRSIPFENVGVIAFSNR